MDTFGQNLSDTLWVMESKKRFRMTGVNSVLRFSDGEVTVEGKDEILSVEGKDLRIENLSKSDETIVITGNMTGVFLSEKEPEGQGFFRKLFK